MKDEREGFRHAAQAVFDIGPLWAFEGDRPRSIRAMAGIPDRRVTIVPPRAEWPEEFRRVARSLQETLGPLALRIDHIGSTSVPGLAAKDVIDVQLTVADLDVRLAPLIEAAGFTGRPEISADHRPPGATGEGGWRKLFFQPRDGRPVNLHVRVAGAPNQRYALLFRDYLKAHSSAADAYAELKRRLAALGIDRGLYAEVKDPACDLIMVAAEDWAARTGWTP
jgi:GrpB-like predicted nucleotidyltransferase (UPF0157 family)